MIVLANQGSPHLERPLSPVIDRSYRKPKLKLPPRPASTGYVRTPRDMQTFVPDHAAALLSPGGTTPRTPRCLRARP